MHADGDWQTVEGVLSKDMATVDEYLQIWKLKINTTKAALTVFYLNNKEGKRDLKVIHNKETLPFWSEPKYLGVTLIGQDTHVRPKPRVTSQKVEITCCTLEATCWLWLGCWSNNVVNIHLYPDPFNSRALRSCLVLQCSQSDTRLLDPATNDAFQTVTGCLCPKQQPIFPSSEASNCWAPSQRSHTVSRTPCQGAWTSAPLSAHLSIEWECTASQIETPICTGRTTTHQFISQQQNKCGALGGSRWNAERLESPTTLRTFIPDPPPWNSIAKNNMGPAQPPPHRCRTFPFLFA